MTAVWRSEAQPQAPDDPVTRALGLEATGFSKRFGERFVLRDVDLSIAAGEVRALLGQNGSGKSTFIKILSGFHHPEPGAQLEVGGIRASLPLSTREARHLGLVFVHQDLALAPTEPIVDNIRLNLFASGGLSRIHWRREREAAAAALEALGLSLDVRRPVGDLTQAEQTVVALARAIGELGGNTAGVLVLDEVTASLPLNGVERVFTAVRRLREAGLGILHVTHRLEEVFEISDTLTILRDGRVALDGPTGALTRKDLVSAIVGQELEELTRRVTEPAPAGSGAEVLDIEHLCGSVVDDVSIRNIRPGEIVGVTGLVGSGFEELPYLLFGSRPVGAGWLRWRGHRVDLDRWGPSDALRNGFALLPADRRREGGVGEASLRENVTLAKIDTFWRAGWLQVKAERGRARELLELFGVRPADPEALFETLSGGNQQKTLLAKELFRGPQVFLLVEPTHGIDVGAKVQVMRMVREYAEAGHLVVIASSEYEEVSALCNRVAVLREGRLAAELTGSDVTREGILACCYA